MFLLVLDVHELDRVQLFKVQSRVVHLGDDVLGVAMVTAHGGRHVLFGVPALLQLGQGQLPVVLVKVDGLEWGFGQIVVVQVQARIVGLIDIIFFFYK